MDQRTSFIFSDQDRTGTVTVQPSAYGVEVTVADGDTRWEFLVDLFYLAQWSKRDIAQDQGRCVPILAYSPTNLDGDPLRRVRVWSDGRSEIEDSSPLTGRLRPRG